MILSRVRGKAVGLGTEGFDERQIQKYFAYMLGPQFTELVLGAGENYALDATAIARELWRDFVADQHALVSRRSAGASLFELVLRAA